MNGQSVIERDQVLPSWKPETHTAEINQYDSRSIFLFSRLPTEIVGNTKISIITGMDVLEPHLWDQTSIDYDFEYQNSPFSTELEIQYQCLKPGVSTILLDIPIINRINNKDVVRNFEISWEKICGEGPREGIRLGTGLDKTDVVIDGYTKEDWRGSLIVPKSKVTTTFYLSIDQSYGTQFHFAPMVKSSDSSVEVHVRGLGSVDSMLLPSSYQEIIVVYECKMSVMAEIVAELSLPTFDPIVWRWKKNCGSEIKKVDIGISRNTREVYRDGQFVENFKQWKALAKDSSTKFYARLGKGESEVKFSGIVISSSPHGVMRPVLTIEDESGNQVDKVISSDKNTVINVQYGCMKRGEADVQISIVIPGMKIVEFNWTKKCIREVETDFDSYGWTTNQNLALLIVLTIVFGLGWYWWSKNGKLKSRHKDDGIESNYIPSRYPPNNPKRIRVSSPLLYPED